MKQLFISLVFCSITITSLGQAKGENLKIVWPEEYQWKIGSNQENEKMHVLEIVPGKEDITHWTMLGTMMSMKNVKISSIDQVVSMYKESALKESPKAKLTVLEKDNFAKNSWVLFKVETPSFPNDPNPESLLYYSIQGEATLYINSIAIKENKLSDAFTKKWTKVFKASEFVSE